MDIEPGSGRRPAVLGEPPCRLVEIEQTLPGFDRFIGSWVYHGDLTLVVDVGTAHSAGDLAAVLGEIGVERVDYVLLTHIHLDHSGGLKAILDRFPMARAICHDSAITHLVDPSKLWEASLAVLKDKAEAFGTPAGVEQERLISHKEAAIEGLTVVETPGHAPHHLSFSYGRYLFAGEAAGNFYALSEGEFLRPATPPRFFLETFLASLDRLAALEDQPICYAHFGQASHSRRMVERFRAQILRWRTIIAREREKKTEDLVARCVDVLLENDPELCEFHRMDAAVQARERYFMANSVRGFLGYLKEKEGTEG